MKRRLLGASCAAVAAMLTIGATPAFADAGSNTNYLSVVTSITPATAAVTARVSGGDSFLEITVGPGHVVVIDGYEREPYLQILADGTVQTNQKSPATYLNNDRYAATALPPDADAKAPPVWKTVATGGTYAWHSHLIHFMSPGLPETLKQQGRESGFVQDWTIALTIDGVPSKISGTLNLLDAPSPIIPIIIVILAAGIGWIALRKWPIVPVGIVAGGLAIAVSVTEQGSVPKGTPTQTWVVVLGIVVVAFGALGILARKNVVLRSLCQLACGAVSVMWAITQFSVIRNAVLVSSINPALARIAIATCFGFGCALAIRALPGLSPSLDDPSIDDHPLAA